MDLASEFYSLVLSMTVEVSVIQPKQSTSQSAVAVEKTGTENEVILFSLQCAEVSGFHETTFKGVFNFSDCKFYRL